MNVIKNKIKLIIWDLDETFWNGTFSEEGVSYSKANHDLVIELSQRGIVNSICSKNESSEIEVYLKEKNILEYFVFSEISWNPKGKAVNNIIADMGLRAENVLFIDDNLGNLNEVAYENPGISFCEPSIIKSLKDSPYTQGKEDLKLTRLQQYKTLESKREIKKEKNLSNHDFLIESEIKVSIITDINVHIDRIVELVERTNQLNYTKKRPDRNELITELKDNGATSGVIKVIDKYGDYGISGFFLLKKGELKHFLFSCRTMNMGVENWLYQHLGCPNIKVSGDVASKLNSKCDVSYISVKEINESKEKTTQDKGKYLLVGGCDLDQVIHYLSSKKISTQFNFVNNKNISVHTDHSCFIKQSFSKSALLELNSLDIYAGFNGQNKVFDESWDVLIYSPLNDYSRGLYKSKKSGIVFPFDSLNIDWTNESNHKVIPSHLEGLSNDFFENFKNNYIFEGAITPSEFHMNLVEIITKFPNKYFLLLTGAEINVDFKTDAWDVGMHIRHQEMNLILEELADKYINVELIDVRKFVKSPQDVTNNIRHYIKPIYAKIASDIAENKVVSDLKSNNGLLAFCKKIKRKILNKIKKKFL